MILNASIYIVFALLLIDCALLLLVVMMQRPKQEGLGAAFGAQMTDQAFGAQTTDVLKKGTVLFGSLFMILSFVLAVLMNAQFQMKKSTLSTEAPVPVKAEEQAPAPATAPMENLEILEATTPGTQPSSATAAPAAPAAALPTAPAVEAPTAPSSSADITPDDPASAATPAPAELPRA